MKTTMTHSEIVAACFAAVNDRDPRIVAALDIIETAFRDLSRTNDLEAVVPTALQHVYEALLERHSSFVFCSTGHSAHDIEYLCTIEPEVIDPHGRTIFEATAVIESTFRNLHSPSYAYQAFNALEDVEHILSRPTSPTVSQPAPVQAGPA